MTRVIRSLSLKSTRFLPQGCHCWVLLCCLRVSRTLGLLAAPFMLAYSLGVGTSWLQLLSRSPEPTACILFLKGPDLTSRKVIPVGSSPRPHLPGDSFLEAVTATATAEAATVELIGYGRSQGQPVTCLQAAAGPSLCLRLYLCLLFVWLSVHACLSSASLPL